MLSLLFLIASIFWGMTIVMSLLSRLTRLELWVWGTTVGLVLSAYIGLGLAYIGGWSSVSQLAATLVILSLAFILWLRHGSLQEFERIGEGKPNIFIIVFTALIVLFIGSTTLTDQNGVWQINNSNNYGDIRLHLAYITNFVSGQNIPVENPIFSGTPPSYPFLINVVTAQLVQLGMPIPTAINLLSVIFLTTIALTMYCFALRLTNNRGLASLVPFFLFTSGGLGAFAMFFPEWAAHNFALSYFMETVHDYTIWSENGYHFGNSITTYFNPQRAFLLGFPMVMIILTELYKLTGKTRWKTYLFIGMCIATLPLVHTSSLLVVALFLPYFLIKNWHQYEKKRQFFIHWGILVMFASVIGLSLLKLFISQSNSLASYVYLQGGWIAHSGPLLIFWLKNAGPALIIGLFALALAKRKGESWGPFVLYSFILFVFANFVITQPWDFDNSKYLVYWYACISVALAWICVYVSKKGWRLLSLTLIIILSLSGAIDLARRTLVTRNWYPIVQSEEFNHIILLRDVIPAKSRVLTIGDKLDTVTPLLGRRLVFGDDPWLWSHGIPGYKQRLRDVHTIYRGGNEATSLINAYGIDYVIVSNNERKREPHLNELFFVSRYERVYTDLNKFNVYKITP